MGKFPRTFRQQQKALSDPIIKLIKKKFRISGSNFFSKQFFRNEQPYIANETEPYLVHTLCGDDFSNRRDRDEKLGELIAFYRTLGFETLSDSDKMLAMMISKKYPTWVVTFYGYPSEGKGLELSHHIYATELDRFRGLRQGKGNHYASALEANVKALTKTLKKGN